MEDEEDSNTLFEELPPFLNVGFPQWAGDREEDPYPVVPYGDKVQRVGYQTLLIS